MSQAFTYRFIVTYEGQIDANDPDQARLWAEEEVEHGLHRVTSVEVERKMPRDPEAA